MLLRSALTAYYTNISLFINLLEPMKIHSFLHRRCLAVLRISIHVFWIFVSCLWADHSEFMALFMVFILLIVQVLVSSLVVNF